MRRNNVIDTLRGFTIISMVLYHFFYDLVYVFNYNVQWYTTEKTFLWQQSICMSFIILSGISTNFTTKNKLLKNGIKVFMLGILITLITKVCIPDELIVFGILNFMGLAMIIVSLIKPIIEKIDYKIGLLISLIFFCITYKIGQGYLDLIFTRIAIPKSFYGANLFYLGFPSANFQSADYFPLIPWFWLYLCGFFIGKKLVLEKFLGVDCKETLISKIGKNSLIIYLLHQAVIYGLILGFDKIFL